MSKRRVPIWSRNGVYYWTDAKGRRVSLKTKDRAAALARYAERAARAAADPPGQSPAREPPTADLPPPPPPAATQSAPRPDPPAPPPGTSPPGGGPARPDPLHSVGATATAAPAPAPPPPEGGPPPGAPTPEEIEMAAREMALIVVGAVGQLTGAIALARNGRVGAVRDSTYRRNVDVWMVITRRWAAEWQMGPWTAIGLATASMAKEQWTGEAGSSGPVDSGVPVHPSAQAA